MEEPVIFKKGPIALDMEPGTYYWCACGKSGKQPFCDGSHKGTGITPVAETIGEAKKVFWCGCKHTGNKPTCDGSHSRI